MDSQFKEIDLTLPKPRKVPGHSFTSDELVVFNLPAYGGRPAKNLDDFFSVLKGDSTAGRAGAMQGN